MIFGLLYFCVVISSVNKSRTSFILYRIVKRHSRQSNVRRIWTCANNGVGPGSEIPKTDFLITRLILVHLTFILILRLVFSSS